MPPCSVRQGESQIKQCLRCGMGKGGQKEGRGIAEESLQLGQIAGYPAAEHDVGALSAAGRRDFPHGRLVHGGWQGGTGGAQKILPVHKAAPGVCDHADARFAGGKEKAEGHGAREGLERIERRNGGSGSPAEGGGGRQREPEAGKSSPDRLRRRSGRCPKA